MKYIIFFLLALPIITLSQYSTKNKKAIKHFEAAKSYYNQYDEINAIYELKYAIKADSNFAEPYNFLASIYEQKKDFEKVIHYYSKSVNVQPHHSYKTYYFLGEAQLRLGKYQDAKQSFESCINFDNVSARYKALSEALLKRAEFGIKAVNNPVNFNPVNMGENINTQYNDYWPSLTIDNNILVTTVLLPKDARFPVSYKNSQEDFFIAFRKNNQWTKTRNMGPPINTEDNEGAQSISPDGRFLFYSVCNKEGDYGSCDIYFTKKNGHKWEKPRNIGAPVSSPVWESNPTFSSDGKTLIFSADHRRGGYGKKDLWQSTRLDDGTWTIPVNLGNLINSDGNDIAPFIHPDNKTLYFASDGHQGLGGMDLFVSRKNKDGIWQKPVNLGYPINTYKDEFGLIVNAKGDLAMYSAEREDSKGQDIYSFILEENMRPSPVSYVKGVVYNAVTKEKIGAKFQLVDLETSKIMVVSASDSITGEYIVCLPPGKNYMFNTSKKGFLFFSENFSLKDSSGISKPFVLNIPLQPLTKGVKVVLKNIFFETDSYKLKPESQAELQKLIDFLNYNMRIKVEIGGHTDNVGTKSYNQSLSENRAKTVFDYLVNHGIEQSRLSYRGYNFSKPIDNNDTEAGRANNRRTEFRIVEVE